MGAGPQCSQCGYIGPTVQSQFGPACGQCQQPYPQQPIVQPPGVAPVAQHSIAAPMAQPIAGTAMPQPMAEMPTQQQVPGRPVQQPMPGIPMPQPMPGMPMQQQVPGMPMQHSAPGMPMKMLPAPYPMTQQRPPKTRKCRHRECWQQNPVELNICAYCDKVMGRPLGEHLIWWPVVGFMALNIFLATFASLPFLGWLRTILFILLALVGPVITFIVLMEAPFWIASGLHHVGLRFPPFHNPRLITNQWLRWVVRIFSGIVLYQVVPFLVFLPSFIVNGGNYSSAAPKAFYALLGLFLLPGLGFADAFVKTMWLWNLPEESKLLGKVKQDQRLLTLWRSAAVLVIVLTIAMWKIGELASGAGPAGWFMTMAVGPVLLMLGLRSLPRENRFRTVEERNSVLRPLMMIPILALPGLVTINFWLMDLDPVDKYQSINATALGLYIATSDIGHVARFVMNTMLAAEVAGLLFGLLILWKKGNDPEALFRARVSTYTISIAVATLLIVPVAGLLFAIHVNSATFDIVRTNEKDDYIGLDGWLIVSNWDDDYDVVLLLQESVMIESVLVKETLHPEDPTIVFTPEQNLTVTNEGLLEEDEYESFPVARYFYEDNLHPINETEGIRIWRIDGPITNDELVTVTTWEIHLSAEVRRAIAVTYHNGEAVDFSLT